MATIHVETGEKHGRPGTRPVHRCIFFFLRFPGLSLRSLKKEESREDMNRGG